MTLVWVCAGMACADMGCAGTASTDKGTPFSVTMVLQRSYTEPGSESEETKTITATSSGTLSVRLEHTWHEKKPPESCIGSTALSTDEIQKLATMIGRMDLSSLNERYDGSGASDLDVRVTFKISTRGREKTVTIHGIGSRPEPLGELGSILEEMLSDKKVKCST